MYIPVDKGDAMIEFILFDLNSMKHQHNNSSSNGALSTYKQPKSQLKSRKPSHSSVTSIKSAKSKENDSSDSDDSSLDDRHYSKISDDDDDGGDDDDKDDKGEDSETNIRSLERKIRKFTHISIDDYCEINGLVYTDFKIDPNSPYHFLSPLIAYYISRYAQKLDIDKNKHILDMTMTQVAEKRQERMALFHWWLEYLDPSVNVERKEITKILALIQPNFDYNVNSKTWRDVLKRIKQNTKRSNMSKDLLDEITEHTILWIKGSLNTQSKKKLTVGPDTDNNITIYNQHNLVWMFLDFKGNILPMHIQQNEREKIIKLSIQELKKQRKEQGKRYKILLYRDKNATGSGDETLEYEKASEISTSGRNCNCALYSTFQFLSFQYNIKFNDTFIDCLRNSLVDYGLGVFDNLYKNANQGNTQRDALHSFIYEVTDNHEDTSVLSETVRNDLRTKVEKALKRQFIAFLFLCRYLKAVHNIFPFCGVRNEKKRTITFHMADKQETKTKFKRIVFMSNINNAHFSTVLIDDPNFIAQICKDANIENPLDVS